MFILLIFLLYNQDPNEDESPEYDTRYEFDDRENAEHPGENDRQRLFCLHIFRSNSPTR